MRYFSCLSCHRKHKLLGNEELLTCSCGEYDENLLIETDAKGGPLRKEGKDGRAI